MTTPRLPYDDSYTVQAKSMYKGTHLKAVLVIDHGRLHSQQCSDDDILDVVEQLVGGVSTCRAFMHDCTVLQAICDNSRHVKMMYLQSASWYS